MAAIIFLSAIVAGIISRKSKICTTYIFVVMYLFAAFRTYDPDYNNYLIEFQNLNYSTELRYVGYTSFIKLFHTLGLDFNQYNYVFYFIVFLLLIIGINLLTENVNSVLACYMIHSYALDVIQMKSAMANALIIVAIAIVIRITFTGEKPYKRQKSLAWIISLFCCLAAISMHFSALFYVVAIVLYLILRNHRDIGAYLFFFMVVAFLLVSSGFLVAVMKFANSLGIVNDIDYLSLWSIKATRLGYLIYFGIIALIILSCRLNKAKVNYDGSQLAISNFMLTSMLAVPFLYLNGHYSRLLRIYMVLMYVFFSRLPRSLAITWKIGLNYLMFSIALITFFYMDIGSNYAETLGALLHCNSILSSFA